MYITYGKVFRGTPNILKFWLFLENGSISERTAVNRALGGIPIDRGSDRPIFEKGPLDRGSDRPIF